MSVWVTIALFFILVGVLENDMCNTQFLKE